MITISNHIHNHYMITTDMITLVHHNSTCFVCDTKLVSLCCDQDDTHTTTCVTIYIREITS